MKQPANNMFGHAQPTKYGNEELEFEDEESIQYTIRSFAIES